MTYEEYIASKNWNKKRKARLKLDGNRCRLCDENGSRFRLEVHHRPKSYDKIPFETVEDDLITVCSRCHDFITDVIREDRYGRRELQPTQITTNIQERQEINHGLANSQIQVDFVRPVDHAQRPDGRPAEQMVEIAQTDLFQENEDRGRSRGNGTA
jgi:hypothetical protein